MGLSPYLLAAFLLLAADARAEQAPKRNLAMQIAEAAAKGNVALMNALRGTELAPTIRLKKAWRVTKEYRDQLVEIELDGVLFEALVRFPKALQLPKQGTAIRAKGTLVDFEPYGSGGRIAWQPVILASNFHRPQ